MGSPSHAIHWNPIKLGAVSNSKQTPYKSVAFFEVRYFVWEFSLFSIRQNRRFFTSVPNLSIKFMVSVVQTTKINPFSTLFSLKTAKTVIGEII